MWSIKYLRLLLLWIAAAFAAIHSAGAQSYSHVPGDTLTGHAAFHDVGVFNITQQHPTADTLYFTWYKQSVAMPLGWTASICDNGNCYTSLTDSGHMAPIVPGDNGLMSLHLDPGSEAGTGIIRYTLHAANSPGQIDTLTWIITAGGASGLPETTIKQPVVYVSCGEIRCRQLQGSYNLATLYDGNGKLRMRCPVHGDDAAIPLAGCNPGIFILRLSGKRNFIMKVLNR